MSQREKAENQAEQSYPVSKLRPIKFPPYYARSRRR